jgi:hypothetical protein
MLSFGVRPKARLRTSLIYPTKSSVLSQRLRRRCRRVDTSRDIICECPTLVVSMSPELWL